MLSRRGRLSKRGETIRINFFGGLEDTARYSNNLEEALANGLEMAGRGNPAPTMQDFGAD